MGETNFEPLQQQVRGEIVTASDDGYDDARKVYNAMIDRRPLVVVRAVDDSDVMAAVKFAAGEGLTLSVRGGSHSVPGFGTNDGGLVIDLSQMKGSRVDPASRTVRVQGGATLGDLDHATGAYGLAVPGGVVSTTGVAGLTLGGGIGHLSRGAGLSIDNLISADVVTADGNRVTASESENPDLFWALRGGGGNFGVVTNFEFKCQQVGMIIGGPMVFELSDAEAMLRRFREVIADAPRELGAFFGWHLAPPLPFIPENRHMDPVCMIVACWTGAPDQADKALAPFRDVGTPIGEHVGPAPFAGLNAAFDPLLPPGLQHYWKANYVTEITDEFIAAHLEHGPKVPAVNSAVHIYPINGACHDVAPDATAFGHRDASYASVIAGMWPDPTHNEANIAWVRAFSDAQAPHSQAGGYINFMAEDDQSRVAENYGANYQRLQQVKKTYDPNNLFNQNQNIKPA